MHTVWIVISILVVVGMVAIYIPSLRLGLRPRATVVPGPATTSNPFEDIQASATVEL